MRSKIEKLYITADTQKQQNAERSERSRGGVRRSGGRFCDSVHSSQLCSHRGGVGGGRISGRTSGTPSPCCPGGTPKAEFNKKNRIFTNRKNV